MNWSRKFALGLAVILATCVHGQVRNDNLPAQSIVYTPDTQGCIMSDEDYRRFVEEDFEYTVIKDDSVVTCALSRNFYLTMRLNSEKQKRSITVPAYVKHNGRTYTVESIHVSGFSGCTDVDTIILSEGIWGVNPLAFSDCRSLKYVYIPASVENISGGIFDGCASLESVIIDKDNPYYESQEGSRAIMGKGTHTLVDGCASATIPDGVRVIGEKAFFRHEDLENVVIPEGVTEIEDGAFEQCTALKRVSLPKSLKRIGNHAFSGCVSLDSLYIPEGVSEIMSISFTNCSGLVSVNVSPKNKVYDSRGNCNAIMRTADDALVVACKNTVIPETAKRLCSESFEGCGIKSVHIPASVSTIEVGAFDGCPTLVALTVDSGNRRFDSRGGCNAVIETGNDKLVAGCNATIIPADIKEIGAFAMKGVSLPARLSLPQGLTKIRRWAFIECADLEYVHIPETVTSMEESAFSGCRNLKAVRFDARLDKMPYGTFTDCDKLEYIEINNNSTEIGAKAFSGCTSLKRVILPGTIKEIGWHAFRGCPVENDIKRLCDDKGRQRDK